MNKSMNILYELHPLCTIFPRLNDAEFSALCEDIRANGLRQPIILHQGMVLDGGNRYRACQKVGVEPRFEQYAGDDVLAFVFSANLHRRHLEAGQRAVIVALAQDWAKANTRGGDRKSSQVATLPLDDVNKNQSKVLDFDFSTEKSTDNKKTSVDKRASQAETSRVTQMMADKVARAAPELAKKVAEGEISLPKALKQIDPDAAKPKQKKLSSFEKQQAMAQEFIKKVQEARDPTPEEVKALTYEDGLEDGSKEAEHALNSMAERLKELEAENQALRDELAAYKAQDDTQQAAEIHKEIAELREKVRILGIKNETLTRTHDMATDDLAAERRRANWLHHRLKELEKAQLKAKEIAEVEEQPF